MRQITSNSDALEYIRCALKFSGHGEFDSINIMDLPNILEKFDEEWELEQADADYIMSMIMENYDKFELHCFAQQN
jgi:hypothetical protein